MTTTAATLPARVLTWRRSGDAIELLLWCALLLAPMGRACVPERWRAVLVTAICSCAAIAGAVLALRRARLKVPAAALPGFLLVFWGVLQAFVPGWNLTAAAGEIVGGTRESISLVPERTLMRAQEAWAWLLLFGVAAAVGARPSRLNRFGLVMLTCGAFWAVVGLGIRAEWWPRLWEDQNLTWATGPFVNRNHYAGMLVIGILAGADWLLRSPRLRLAPFLALALPCVLAIFASGSRGGLLALAVGGAYFVVRQRAWPLSIRVAGVVLPALTVVAVLPHDVVARLGAVGDHAGGRIAIWESGMRLGAAFPWFGSGLGTYRDVSPFLQDPSILGRVEHAHCDPLQLWVECGLVGVALFAWLLYAVFRGNRAAAGRSSIGLQAALVAIACHCLVEFHARIPAMAVWMSIVAGLSVAHCRPLRVGPAALGAAAALSLWIAVDAGTRARGVSMAVVASSQQAPDRAVSELRRAHVVDPALGVALIDAGWRRLEEDGLAVDAEMLERWAREALAHNPFDARGQHLLGVALRLQGKLDGSRVALRRSLELVDPSARPDHRLRMASAALTGGDPELGREWGRQLLSEHPDRRRECVAEFYRAQPMFELLQQVLPEDLPDVYEFVADELLRVGAFADREVALGVAAGRSEVDPTRLTIPSGAVMTQASVELVDDTNLDVRIALENPRATPLTLIATAEGARVEVSFAAESHRRWQLDLGTPWPSGRCEVWLKFDDRAPPYPLGAVYVEPTLIHLGSESIRAERLAWFTNDPKRRDRTRGVPLRDGDSLWAAVTCPEGQHELVCAGHALDGLRVSLDGEQLKRLGIAVDGAARFAFRGGGKVEPVLLEFRSEDGRRVVLESFFRIRVGDR